MPRKFYEGVDLTGQRLRNVATPTASADGVPKSFIRYDLSTFATGKPAASEVLLDFACPIAFTLPIGFAGSVALAGTAPAAAVTFSVTKNGTQIGTINFALGATTATFTAASAVSFVVGDRIKLIAPATQDSALSDLTFTLAGSR
jgi:hypothetical protein